MVDAPSPSPSPATDNDPPAWKLVDGARLIAALRAGDDEAINEAYRRTFAGELGQLVLAHHLMSCGVGKPEGRGLTADDRTYNAALRDGALDLMSRAGFDEASAATAVLTDYLEGQTHDRSEPEPEPGPYADPAGEPWD